MIYLTLKDGTRAPLDEKVKLVIEGVEHELVGAHLDFYDVDYTIGDGHLGDDPPLPARIFRLTDRFIGLTIDVPFLMESAAHAGGLLATPPEPEKKSRLRLRR